MKAIKVLVLLAAFGGLSYFLYMKVAVLKGSGNVVMVTRDVGDFSGIRLEGAARMSVVQGETPSVQLEAEDNILPQITTEVQGGVLKVSTGEGVMSVSPSKPIGVTITAMEISSIGCSGAGSVAASGIKGAQIEISGSGAWEFKVDSLEVEGLTVELKGSGTCEVSGKTAVQNVVVSGSGKYHAPRLESRDADITVAGGARATVWAKDALNVKVTGSGKVEYYGKPEVTQEVEGRLAIVKAMGEH